MGVVFISCQAHPLLKEYLTGLGHVVIEVQKTQAVYPAVCAHPDIYLCKVGQDLVIAPQQLELLKDQLDQQHIPYHVGQPLGYRYPDNIKYNAYCYAQLFLHNLAYTDSVLLDLVKKKNLTTSNVSQGYTKCNIVEVGPDSFITSDVGICKALHSQAVDILPIVPCHIALQGFPYGFLGGASGRIDNQVIFHGNLSVHPDFEAILAFIQNKGLKVVYFKEFALTDIGSIIQISGERC